jgi:hypothetical protein
MSSESLAHVSHLQARKTNADTYRTFYELYGENRLQELGGHTVLGRVLHFDVEDTRDVHVVVARANNSINLPVMRNYDRLGIPAHRLRYRASDFLAAATDGVTIIEYGVQRVEGVYRAHLDGTYHQYDPRYEQVHLNLLSEAGPGRAFFRAAGGDGVFNLQNYPVGWILSQLESNRLREEILSSSVVSHLGHTAVPA